MNLTRRAQLLFGTILLVVAAIPATLFLSQQTQEQRSRATASTKLYLTPSTTSTNPLEKHVGDTVSFDVMIDPGANLPSIVKLDLQFDPTKLTVGSTPFVVNTTAFPTTVEGPVVQHGEVLLSLSIGSDATKAIQSVTKVGTLTLKASASTNAVATMVAFGNRSQVLSLAKTDQSTENVLSTTSPAYVMIPEPITEVTPTIGLPTPTIVLPTLTPKPSPTAIPQPTATIAPNDTRLNFTIYMHGIGNSGDNANPNISSLSTKNPLHTTRTITTYIYDDQNNLITTQNGTITYNATAGDYIGSVELGSGFTDGYYTVRVKEDTHLRRLVPGIQHIITGKDNAIPAVTLVTGDVNNDNALNILDYNIIIGCYSDLLPALACTDTNKTLADINDEGHVNQFDYNLFLREITVQSGN